MSVFRSRGFDSLIGKGTIFRGEVTIAVNSTLEINGELQTTRIDCEKSIKPNGKATLMVNGVLNVLPVAGTENAVVVDNVIINGKVACNELRVEGMLAIKSTAVLKAQRIFYRQLVIETGAVVHGQMLHLDHVSEEGPEVVDSEARK